MERNIIIENICTACRCGERRAEEYLAAELRNLRELRGWKNKVHAVNKKLCAILDIYKKCGYVTEYELLRNEPRSLVRGLEILGEIKKVEIRKNRETETSAEKTAEQK